MLDALIAEIGRQKRGGGGNALASLKEEVAAAKTAWLAEWGKQLESDETPINQYRVIRDLMRTVDRDNVIITHDSGSPREQLLPFWETTAPGSYMGWGKSTQLGYGLGIIMGAKLAAAGQALRQRHGRRRHRHDRHGHRDRRAQPHRDPHRGVQQRRHGAPSATCSSSPTKKYGALTVGGNYTKVAEGLNVAATPGREAGRHRAGDQGGRRGHAIGRAVPARDRGQGGLRLLALSARGVVAAGRWQESWRTRADRPVGCVSNELVRRFHLDQGCTAVAAGR